MSAPADRAYLDCAATTPVREAVLAAMLPTFRDQPGNPSSPHRAGGAAAEAITRGRRRVAEAANVDPSHVIFTGGGTEANVLAIRSAVAAGAARGSHVVSTAVEHPAVRETLRVLQAAGVVTLTELTPDRSGRVTPDAIVGAMTDGTILICVMQVQNETGVVTPVDAIAAAARARDKRCWVHTDAVQGFGKLALPEVDSAAISAHKIGGPKGIGALIAKKPQRLTPVITGGGQESGARSGTENVPGIVGFGEAARLTATERAGFITRSARWRASCAEAVRASRGEVIGDAGWMVCATFAGVKGEVLLHALEDAGVTVGTTSACASRRGKPSYVLEAMGLSAAAIESQIRVSFGFETTDAEIALFVQALPDALARASR
jgi:cysteine desulfurase